MKTVSSFSKFFLPDLDALEQYASPDDEVSIIKDVPICQLEQVRQVFRRVGRLEGRGFRVIYRGPRGRYRHQASTWKQDAVRFAVYERT